MVRSGLSPHFSLFKSSYIEGRLFIWLLPLNRDLDWWDWAYTYRIDSALWSPDMNGSTLYTELEFLTIPLS